MKTIVNNINNGEVINTIFNYWLLIKNRMQFEIFEEMIQENKFGTYKNQNVSDAIELFGKGNCSQFEREAFIRECKQAEKKQH